jgi:glycosyltransferase involved in cell wall biosynthesis
MNNGTASEWSGMRILTLSYEFPPVGGGGSKVVHGLARELVAAGHEVDVVTMAFRGLRRRERVDGIEVHRVPCWRRSAAVCQPLEMASYLGRAFPYVVRLARERGYDVNHTHFILPDGILALALARRLDLPYVLTPHGSDVPGYNPDRFTRLHRLTLPVWRDIVGGAARLVSPSEHLAGMIRRHAAGAPLDVIPNGIDVARFRATRARRDRVLVVSRLFRRKGVQHLLAALDGAGIGWEVDVVGAGPSEAELRAQAAALDVPTPVHFHGWLDNTAPELRELYETSRVFVFPSEAENFPVVLLEAMAAGLAIVTTRGTGCDAVVGDAGITVPPRDPLALRAALRRLVAEPALCRELGRAARARLEHHFGWPAVAARYAEVYADVHAQHGRPARVPAPVAAGTVSA